MQRPTAAMTILGKYQESYKNAEKLRKRRRRERSERFIISIW